MGFFRHIKEISAFLKLPKDQRRIVFYSEGKAYWPHLGGILKEFLDQSGQPVCYVTSGEDDPGLSLQHPRLHSFKIDEGFIRNWFFENLEADLMVMTMPDLQTFQIKRSKHPVHYVYVHHSLVSCHMVYREAAFDHFDTVFCSGPHHIKELRALEKKHNLPPKNLVEHGYSRLDSIIANQNTTQKEKGTPPHILIAPSWGENALIETCGEEVVTHLLDHGYQVTLRPHPQTVKFAKTKLGAISKKHKTHPLFTLEVDVASQASLHDSDLMISDWSGAALDYAFGLEKPVLFIDVPRKVNNRNYEALQIEPFEAAIREKIGCVVSPREISKLHQQVEEILSTNQWKSSILKARDQHLYNACESDRVGAMNLIQLSQRKAG